jgi:hypothetical protein
MRHPRILWHSTQTRATKLKEKGRRPCSALFLPAPCCHLENLTSHAKTLKEKDQLEDKMTEGEEGRRTVATLIVCKCTLEANGIFMYVCCVQVCAVCLAS